MTNPSTALLRYDRALGTRWVVGADEAGRGALAGPLVAAAVLLEPGSLRRAERSALAALDDSKRVPAARRVELAEIIVRVAAAVAVSSVSAQIVDREGVQAANLGALARAVRMLDAPSDRCVLVDGYALGDDAPAHRRLVRGDGTSAAVAAASIIAKVARDRLMAALDARHPGYAFGAHAGYGTAAHRAAIATLGPSPQHRRSFGSLRDAA
jgi:ribonuclease HII